MGRGQRREIGVKRAGETFFLSSSLPMPPLTYWTNWTNLSAMKTVNIHEAQTNFSRLLAKLEKDSESIVICRNGDPVADLVPHRRTDRIKAHPALRKIKIGYGLTVLR
ncbi:MAG: type II toxin-antitoxin system Phd/YefM family antitoxin [Limisphaerales bacterium]